MTTQNQNPEAKKFGILNILLILGLSVLLCGEAYCGYHLHELSSRRTQIKEDFSTINSITFGIFSVNQWRDKIAAVVNSQVRDFNLTAAQKKALKAQIEQQLRSLVNKAIATVNKPQHTISGSLTKIAFNKFVNTDKIQAQVPSFAQTIINKVNSPASIKRLKDVAGSKLKQLEKETYDSTETASVAVSTYMLRKYHASDAKEFDRQLNSQLDTIRTASYNYVLGMLSCILIVLGMWWLLRNQVHLRTTLYVMSVLFALVMITVGVTASIIEVDARIKTLNFMLMGQKVAFENEVLFFQSKSIAGIIEVLVKQPKPDAVLVGSLLLIFVVIFPMLRLIFTGVHILKKEFAENKVVNYFAFQSAKWSMADVMVVGILMTYIGLNGILESQLSNLNIHNSLLTTVTTNYTALQPGYFVFVVFVIYSVILTTILKRITTYDAG